MCFSLWFSVSLNSYQKRNKQNIELKLCKFIGPTVNHNSCITPITIRRICLLVNITNLLSQKMQLQDWEQLHQQYIQLEKNISH